MAIPQKTSGMGTFDGNNDTIASEAVATSSASKKWCCDICRNAWFDDFAEACAHEAACVSLHSSKESSKVIEEKPAKPVHQFFTADFHKKKKQKKQQRETSGTTKRKVAASQPAKKPQATNSSSKTTSSETVDLTDPSLLEEQRKALTFFSKRASKPIKNSSGPSKPKTKVRKGALAPRFPVPNHVLPLEEDDPRAESLQSNQQTTRPLSLCKLSSLSPESVDECQLFTTNKGENCLANFRNLPADAFQLTLAQALRGQAVSVDVDAVLRDAVLGSQMGIVRTGLGHFIDHFMVERHKAETRMEAKRQQRATKKKKKRKAVDDDLWFDSDEENEPSKLCVIYGPVGCGKSSLVHSVAREKNNEVLEVHPGELRNGVSLRRRFEEATQSHSSLDMMHKKRAKTMSFFQVQQELVDSDDDEPAESATEESTVSVILIDEVDNLFEEDVAFWNGLKDLTKHSKCPIILTCNNLPKQLLSFHCTYLQAAQPTPKECSAFLRDTLGDQYNCDDLELLAMLGHCDMRYTLKQIQAYSLCPSDVPAPLRESHKCPTEVDKSEPIGTFTPIISSIEPNAVFSDRCTLITIRGSSFLSLMNETGNCHVSIGDQPCPESRVVSDSVILAVCPPRQTTPGIDSTGFYEGTRRRSIAAAYANVVVASSSGTGIQSVSSGRVGSVELYDETEVLVSPQAVLLEIHFPGHTTLSTQNVKATKDGDEGSESENEFALSETVTKQSSMTHHQIAPPPTLKYDRSQVSQILQDAVKEWCAEHGPLPTQKYRVSDVDIDEMEECYLRYRHASDADVLEAGLVGVPYLSGSCRGFGYELTAEFPKRTNENSKPPSEDQLFQEKWKDDCYFFGDSDTYFTQPMGFERELLRQNEAMYRGQVQTIYTDSEEKDQQEGHAEFSALATKSSDEDCYLRNCAPACLEELPSLLLHFHSQNLVGTTDLDVSKIKLDARVVEFRELLTEFIFPGAKREQQYFLAMQRAGSPFKHHLKCGLDSCFSLDYLPALRSMAIYDRSHEVAYKAAVTDDVERGKRSTRRSRRNIGYESYLRAIIPDFVCRHHEEPVQEVRRYLDDSPLLLMSSNKEDKASR